MATAIMGFGIYLAGFAAAVISGQGEEGNVDKEKARIKARIKNMGAEIQAKWKAEQREARLMDLREDFLAEVE